MMVFEERNTNWMAQAIYREFASELATVREPSRNGEVWSIHCPVGLTYLKPMERVNFCKVRDANPFFHLFEAMWMMAGRADVDFVAKLVDRMREFSDDGKHLHGAYGARLSLPVGNQLDAVARVLTQDANSRRAYITLWSPNDLYVESKDLPCNVGMFFRVIDDQLEMTVTNRSNDAVWGGVSGANVVHFSVFQEYVAAKLDIPPGPMHVFTNNLHIYTWNEVAKELMRMHHNSWGPVSDPYESDIEPTPLVLDPVCFIKEVKSWCAEPEDITKRYVNDVFHTLLTPMYRAYMLHKNQHATEYALRILLNDCIESDWRSAGIAWLLRRVKGYASEQSI